jgi:hypothetical protein
VDNTLFERVSLPGSYIPNGSAPGTPSSYGSITIAGIPINYNGNPNFTNYAFVDPEAILNEKSPKPPEPVTPDPVEPPTIIATSELPIANQQRSWGDVLGGVRNGLVPAVDWYLSMTTLPVVEIADNVSTVYNNMRSTGSGRIKSAGVAVAAQAARLTGVENISYAWDATDPVTGEQYSAGWRTAYVILGAGESVATAFGVKAIGESVISGVKSSLKSAATKIDETKGLAVLGHYPKYLELADELNAKRFNIPIEIWNKMTPEQQWNANKKFLDRLIVRGDNVRLSVNVKDIHKKSYLAKELDYLREHGYRVSSDGWWLTKP